MRGVGNRNKSTSAPRMTCTLHGALATRRGGIPRTILRGSEALDDLLSRRVGRQPKSKGHPREANVGSRREPARRAENSEARLDPT
jgi:hypothetical protein